MYFYTDSGNLGWAASGDPQTLRAHSCPAKKNLDSLLDQKFKTSLLTASAVLMVVTASHTLAALHSTESSLAF